MLFKNTLRVVSTTLILFIFFTQIHAATFRGHVFDSKSKEPLIGAVVFDKKNNKLSDVAGLDGTFIINNIGTGEHVFVVRFVGYKSQEKEVDITEHDAVSIDFLLETDEQTLNQVEIVAHDNKEGNAYAMKAEKDANQVLNITSAKSIQLSPDITVANVLQRMSGISVQKTSNSGEGQYAIIRGMDKRYNYTLVNGIKIPSPDDKNRYVPMDIFPAELISRLEVVKALTPEMEGDAIGGAMNLVLKDAPDKLLISANVAAGYNQLFMDRPFYQFDRGAVNLKSPSEMYGNSYHAKPSDFPIGTLQYKAITPVPNFTGGVSFGNRFFNKKLGFILSISNQNTYGGSNTFFASPKAQPNENNKAAFETMEQRTYSTLQNRLGFHNKIDYEFNADNKLSLYNVYFQLDKYTTRHIEETSLGTGVGNVVEKDKSTTQLQRIYNSTLQGKHSLLDGLLFDWSAVYSKAWSNTPDDVQLQVNSTKIDAPTIQSISHKWSHSTDQDLSAYLNLTWTPSIGDKKLEMKIGGMYRHKNRSNFYTEYSLDPVEVNNAPQLFSSIDKAQFVFSGNGADLGSQVNQNDYDVNENVMGYFAQAKFTIFKKLNILAGVRMEVTGLDYMTPMPVTFIGKSGNQSYADILPSVHLKYALAEQQNLRLSYFSSISRPGYFEVIPYLVAGDYFDEEGNPYLKRAKSQNIDLRYEWFPGPSEQILCGLFYKNITDPIEYSLVRDNGPSSLQLKPQNFGNAINYGFEFIAVKYIKNFGFSANYTYTHSSITTQKGSYLRDPQAGLTTSFVDQTRPMQGQADHIGNLAVLYKNQKIGLDLQLSAVYTGKYITQVSSYYNLDYWSMPTTTLDFSFEKKMSKKIKLSLFGKARNLVNSPATVKIMQTNAYYTGAFKLPEQDSPNNIMVQKENYKQNYLLGLRYTF